MLKTILVEVTPNDSPHIVRFIMNNTIKACKFAERATKDPMYAFVDCVQLWEIEVLTEPKADDLKLKDWNDYGFWKRRDPKTMTTDEELAETAEQYRQCHLND